MPSQSTNAGIVTDKDSGERQIPASVRADGTTRKAIKIRPGYRPPEDVEVYKNRTAEAYRDRGRRIGIPGASGLKDDEPEQSSSSVISNKNAKKREARRKAKAAAQDEASEDDKSTPMEEPKVAQVDPALERERKARNLKKKLKQAKDLKNKKDGGETLLPEQIAKVIKINELIRELDALGFGADGESEARPVEGQAKLIEEARE